MFSAAILLDKCRQIAEECPPIDIGAETTKTKLRGPQQKREWVLLYLPHLRCSMDEEICRWKLTNANLSEIGPHLVLAKVRMSVKHLAGRLAYSFQQHYRRTAAAVQKGYRSPFDAFVFLRRSFSKFTRLPKSALFSLALVGQENIGFL